MTVKDKVVEVPTGDLRNIAYRTIIKECERIEHTGKYKGNGHHLAQRLADMISDKLVKVSNTVEKEAVTERTTKSK